VPFKVYMMDLCTCIHNCTVFTTAVIMLHYILCFAVYSVSQVWITFSSE